MAMLGRSALDLAEASEFGLATIRGYEVQKGIPSANTKVLKALMSALERGGIEFSGYPRVNPCVTFNREKRALLMTKPKFPSPSGYEDSPHYQRHLNSGYGLSLMICYLKTK